jgi:hypothetical protein
MRNTLVGYLAIAVLTLAVVFVAISGALPQASAQATGAKGPDILGIRTGMTPQEVYEKLKEIDPTHRVTVGQVLIPPVLGNQPVVYGMSPEALVTGSEIIAVQFSMPPNPQQAWSVYRAINGTIHTTPEQIIASLRQKYGQESVLVSPTSTPGLYWVYDEQGQLASPSVGAAKLHDCGNFLVPTSIGGLSSPGQPPQAGVSSQPIVDPFTITQFQDPTKNLPCQGWVIVEALIAGGVQNGVYTYNLITKITNVNIQKRAAVALSNVLNGIAAKKQQQDLDKARQQSVPKL